MTTARRRLAGPLEAADRAVRDVRDARRLADLRWVVVDVETTGTGPLWGDRITEFAAVVVDGGRITRSWSALVNPQRRIPVFITRLTGISDAMVQHEPTFADRIGEIRDVLGAGTFVAHNAPFDWGFVSAEVQRATGEPLEGDRVCTVRLARKFLQHLPRRSLHVVCHHYGIVNDARHRALGDATATAHLFLRLLDEASRQGIDTWGDLQDLLARRTGARKRRSALPRSSDGGPAA